MGKTISYQRVRSDTKPVLRGGLFLVVSALFLSESSESMQLPFEVNLNSVLMILIGLGCVIVGAALGLRPHYRVLGAGLFIVGFGNLLFAITNGFTDPSPTGRLLFRIAIITYLMGAPLVAYGVLVLVSSG